MSTDDFNFQLVLVHHAVFFQPQFSKNENFLHVISKNDWFSFPVRLSDCTLVTRVYPMLISTFDFKYTRLVRVPDSSIDPNTNIRVTTDNLNSLVNNSDFIHPRVVDQST